MPYLDKNVTGTVGGSVDSPTSSVGDFDDRPTPQGRCNRQAPADIARHGQYGIRTPAVRDSRIAGSTETKVKAEIDIPDRHELYLLGDGEKKVEMETVTQVANAALFTFNKEDHTLANLLRDKLFRLEHVTFAAYKVPHPLFATFELRVHTDGDISPKDAVIQACRELVQELQAVDQEFTKEFELKKMASAVPNGGMEI